MTYRQWTKAFAARLRERSIHTRKECTRIAEEHWMKHTPDCPKEAADEYMYHAGVEIL